MTTNIYVSQKVKNISLWAGLLSAAFVLCSEFTKTEPLVGWSLSNTLMIVFSINSFVAFAAFYKHSVFPLVSFDKSGISIARYLYQRKKITYGSPGVSVSIENGRVSFWQDEVRLLNFSLFGVSKEDVCLIMSEIERGFPVHKPNTQSKV